MKFLKKLDPRGWVKKQTTIPQEDASGMTELVEALCGKEDPLERLQERVTYLEKVSHKLQEGLNAANLRISSGLRTSSSGGGESGTEAAC